MKFWKIKNIMKKYRYEKETILALSIFTEVAWTIAIPVVIFTLLGRYIDKTYEHPFVFTLLGGAVGIGIGMWIVYRRAWEIYDKIDKLSKENINNDNK